jgi:hypothetical protein
MRTSRTPCLLEETADRLEPDQSTGHHRDPVFSSIVAGITAAMRPGMSSISSLSSADLDLVQGGFTPTQVKTIENHAVKYATHQLGGGPVFLGNVNNDTPHQRTFTKQGVLVSTGDEAKSQFYVGRVLINKTGSPIGLKDL